MIVYFIGGALFGFVFGYLLANSPLFKKDGEIVVDESGDEKTTWSLNVNTNPEEFQKKKEIRLSVRYVK